MEDGSFRYSMCLAGGIATWTGDPRSVMEALEPALGKRTTEMAQGINVERGRHDLLIGRLMVRRSSLLFSYLALLFALASLLQCYLSGHTRTVPTGAGCARR